MTRTLSQLLGDKGLRGLSVDLPGILRYDEAACDPAAMVACFEQFNVESSARYARDEYTYCDLFWCDALVACGRPASSHWVWPDGTPCTPYATRVSGNGSTELARELNANEEADWMHAHGAAFGWASCSGAEAQSAADQGRLAHFAWRNPSGGHGHVGMIRPSDGRPGIWLAQAGAVNSSNISITHVFVGATPDFYVSQPLTSSV